MRLKRTTKYRTKKVESRVTEEEKNYIRTKALLYCEGNESEFIRYAALNFVPEKQDIEKGSH